TFNRLDIDNLKQKIINIAKGKTAELLFRFFCVHNNINVDFNACSTPFYQKDNRDFVCEKYEWDIKNNFVYHHSPTIHLSEKYINLPALIPDHHAHDQWSKRDQLYINGTSGVRYLFTFLKNADYYKKGENFIELHLTGEQEQKLCSVYLEYYKQHNPSAAPFTENEFWNLLNIQEKLFSVVHYPQLVITSYADNNHWNLFTSSGPGIKTYCGRLLTTKINNRNTPVRNLPSFLSLFPHLNNELKLAELRR
ncbi:MAG TPA: hypothetical protein VM368_05735, partial [Flavisolibacter sp.]|nr:hypothetical protein [Flavisolibacter sp.]